MSYIKAWPLTAEQARTVRSRLGGAAPGWCHCQESYMPPWAIPETERVAAHRVTNGSIQARIICLACNGWRSYALPHGMLRIADIATLEIVFDVAERGVCQVRGCDELGAEVHHWAPRQYFGDEADDWPMAYLCPRHHGEWHKRINETDE